MLLRGTLDRDMVCWGTSDYFLCFNTALLTGQYAWILFNKQRILQVHVFLPWSVFFSS